jgi:hypothetical protein
MGESEEEIFEYSFILPWNPSTAIYTEPVEAFGKRWYVLHFWSVFMHSSIVLRFFIR